MKVNPKQAPWIRAARQWDLVAPIQSMAIARGASQPYPTGSNARPAATPPARAIGSVRSPPGFKFTGDP